MSSLPLASQEPPVALIVPVLGLSQIVGYGTLYYGLGVLAPEVAASFGASSAWAFGVLSLSFLGGGQISSVAGRLCDRHGAGRLLVPGSIASAATLVLCAIAPDPIIYAIGLIAAGIASTFVQYGIAFAALVQITPARAQRSITLLTLIAGFSSTLFWPLTAALAARLDWRTIYLIFAAMNLVLALPAHVWLARLTQPSLIGARLKELSDRDPGSTLMARGAVGPEKRRLAFVLVTIALALFSLINSSMLIHMLQILDGLGLGAAGIWVSTIFGPAQMTSRLFSIILRREIPASLLALASGLLMPIALVALMASAPHIEGALAAIVVFGLATGLNSIVQGALPLELFGAAGYGAVLGRLNAIRLGLAAGAPFFFSIVTARFGLTAALLALLAGGLASFALMLRIRLMIRAERLG